MASTTNTTNDTTSAEETKILDLKVAITNFLTDQETRAGQTLIYLSDDVHMVSSYVEMVVDASNTFHNLPSNATIQEKFDANLEILKRSSLLHYSLCLVRQSSWEWDVPAYHTLVASAHHEAGSDYVDGLRHPHYHSILRDCPTHLPLYTSFEG
tara:strand:- start:4997 stop:5458 length:462 start_codon:yes stop_codon:yes gene_type:complete